jgi:hypothetical protein
MSSGAKGLMMGHFKHGDKITSFIFITGKRLNISDRQKARTGSGALQTFCIPGSCLPKAEQIERETIHH